MLKPLSKSTANQEKVSGFGFILCLKELQYMDNMQGISALSLW